MSKEAALPNVFGLRQDERTAVFIDGSNLYSASKMLGFDIDYKALLAALASHTKLLRTNYYTAVMEDEAEHRSIQPLIDWLDYNGYGVVTKPTKEFVDSMGRRKVKGNMDIELAVDMMTLAPRLDHALLFSGDGDMRALVEAVQRIGVRVSVVSSLRTQPPVVADELRRQADAFIDLATVSPVIARKDESGMARRPLRQTAPAS